MEEPKVLLDMIVRAVRQRTELNVEFQDHRGNSWILSMKMED